MDIRNVLTRAVVASLWLAIVELGKAASLEPANARYASVYLIAQRELSAEAGREAPH